MLYNVVRVGIGFPCLKSFTLTINGGKSRWRILPTRVSQLFNRKEIDDQSFLFLRVGLYASNIHVNSIDNIHANNMHVNNIHANNIIRKQYTRKQYNIRKQYTRKQYTRKQYTRKQYNT